MAVTPEVDSLSKSQRKRQRRRKAQQKQKSQGEELDMVIAATAVLDLRSSKADSTSSSDVVVTPSTSTETDMDDKSTLHDGDLKSSIAECGNVDEGYFTHKDEDGDCALCGKPAELSCGICLQRQDELRSIGERVVNYCSVECQENHYFGHSQIHRELAENRWYFKLVRATTILRGIFQSWRRETFDINVYELRYDLLAQRLHVYRSMPTLDGAGNEVRKFADFHEFRRRTEHGLPAARECYYLLLSFGQSEAVIIHFKELIAEVFQGIVDGPEYLLEAMVTFTEAISQRVISWHHVEGKWVLDSQCDTTAPSAFVLVVTLCDGKKYVVNLTCHQFALNYLSDWKSFEEQISHYQTQALGTRQVEAAKELGIGLEDDVEKSHDHAQWFLSDLYILGVREWLREVGQNLADLRDEPSQQLFETAMREMTCSAELKIRAHLGF